MESRPHRGAEDDACGNLGEVMTLNKHIACFFFFFFCQKQASCYCFVVSRHRILNNWHYWSPRLGAARWSHLARSGVGGVIESHHVCVWRTGASLLLAMKLAGSGESQRGDSPRRVDVVRGERETEGARAVLPVLLSFCKYLLSSTVHPSTVCVCWTHGRPLADVCVGEC